MNIGIILLIALFGLFTASLPKWPHSRGWSYWPSATLGLMLLIASLLIGGSLL